MINKIKEWGGLVALIAIVLFLVFGRGGSSVKGFGTINGTDVTATRFTQLLVDNGVQITANGLNIVAGGMTIVGNTTNNGIVTQTAQASMTATTTSTCILAAPTATSTFQTSLVITTATSSTQVIAVATTTNTAATSTLNALSTVTNLTGATTPISYKAATGMFATPGTSLIFYYTNLSAGGTGNLANQAGTCSVTYTAL